jgi:retron-type reverse transcriptase
VFQRDWVVDLDVKAFFDSVPWELVCKAVERHATQPWVMLYGLRLSPAKTRIFLYVPAALSF